MHTLRNVLMSPLKLVIVPEVGRNENTAFAPFDPEYKFQVWPASEMLDATGTGWPSEPYCDEIGPALKFASQIMISFVFEPPAVFDVKRSYATSATIVPELLCDHCQTDCKIMRVSQRSSKRLFLTYGHARNGTQLLVDTRI